MGFELEGHASCCEQCIPKQGMAFGNCENCHINPHRGNLRWWVDILNIMHVPTKFGGLLLLQCNGKFFVLELVQVKMIHV